MKEICDVLKLICTKKYNGKRTEGESLDTSQIEDDTNIGKRKGPMIPEMLPKNPRHHRREGLTLGTVPGFERNKGSHYELSLEYG